MYVTTCYTHMNSIVNIVQVFIVEDRIGHQFDVLWALQEECCWNLIRTAMKELILKIEQFFSANHVKVTIEHCINILVTVNILHCTLTVYVTFVWRRR